ncbi:MAG: hypothetical protein F9K19_14385 [Rhizobiaceae bacterium]|nr:MAG: hypothetical protein F9K19_14385 [Rhizobiaceae bacterium]CAG1014745.1 hypothetical protein RHIZO_04864 [Rhizobiaceae bacterium]
MAEPLPPKKARQGRKGVPVLVVLIIGLILAMGAWWVAEYYGAAIEPPEQQQVGDPQQPSAPPVPPGTAAGSD